MGRLPDRWLPYSSVGQPIEGTKFIAFKVPLKDAICRNLRPNERFTPAMLLEQCPRLSLVVDLTNTQRYYNPQEFLSKGVLYKKIFCPGKMIPQEKDVLQFIDIVDEYLKENGNSEQSLIGVHCTHGLNRTAYFICNYMIKRLSIPAQEAISAFEQARGHPIERQEYKDALLNMLQSDNSPRSKSLESPLDSVHSERPLSTKYDTRERPLDSPLDSLYAERPFAAKYDSRERSLDSPLDSLYAERPLTNKYGSRQRAVHGSYNRNPRPYDRSNRQWSNPRHGRNEVHNFQRNEYRTSSEPNEINGRYRFSSDRDRFTWKRPESQDYSRPSSSFVGKPVDSERSPRTFTSKPRFIRDGEGLEAHQESFTKLQSEGQEDYQSYEKKSFFPRHSQPNYNSPYGSRGSRNNNRPTSR